MPRLVFSVALALTVVATLLAAPSSFAQSTPHESTLHEEAAAREVLEGFLESHASVRTIQLAGTTLAPAAGAATSSPLALRGDEVGTLVVPAFAVGGGVRIGPVVWGVELGGGISGGASAPLYTARDIQVRPSGFVGTLTAATYLGVMISHRGYRLRLDGVLGSELVSLGMVRPGYDDTSVRSIAASRGAFGPRARVDFLLRGGGAVGVFAAADALHPGSVAIGVVLTTL